MIKPQRSTQISCSELVKDVQWEAKCFLHHFWKNNNNKTDSEKLTPSWFSKKETWCCWLLKGVCNQQLIFMYYENCFSAIFVYYENCFNASFQYFDFKFRNTSLPDGVPYNTGNVTTLLQTSFESYLSIFSMLSNLFFITVAMIFVRKWVSFLFIIYIYEV